MTQQDPKMMKLRKGEHRVLVEALRRRGRFNDMNSGHLGLCEQWTGLGCATTYKQAQEAGYMEPVRPHPGHACWWRLTPKGAVIVAYWLGLGFDFTAIEANTFPPAQVPTDVAL